MSLVKKSRSPDKNGVLMIIEGYISASELLPVLTRLATAYILLKGRDFPFQNNILTLKHQSRQQQRTFIDIFSFFFRENKT